MSAIPKQQHIPLVLGTCNTSVNVALHMGVAMGTRVEEPTTKEGCQWETKEGGNPKDTNG